ncbi:P-loop containing nucleoside triphosphate hydrolase protein [Lentinula aff. detonsa]|uniref:P-loop containing nucleoside triphosphate hydrolase protein n=1 Tax=Lentinula aff. detonsa TaxID=2804958 RepID=A0AA38KC93_9AGAR|nr:P-loop containing nucleoside triphosphate hydrolase protein [Lentinula aff. detonsa]
MLESTTAMNYQHAPSQYLTNHYYPSNNYPYPVSPNGTDYPLFPGHPFPSGMIANSWPTQPSTYITSSQPSPSLSPILRHDVGTHTYWKGRLAPLAGFSSPSDILNPNHAVEIKKDQTENARPVNVPTPTISIHNDGNSVSSLDKYADIFIPQFLKDVQKQSQHFQPLAPIPIFPPSSYLHSFLPSSIIEKYTSLYPSTILSSTPPDKTAFRPLNAEEYKYHWKSLLSWELDQLATDKQKIILWQVKVRALDWDNAEFSVLVPGIRENYPRLDVGDVLHLREVLIDWKMGSGWAFEGRVTRLRKREGFIRMSYPHSFFSSSTIQIVRDFYCPSLKEHIETFIPAPGRDSAQGVTGYKSDEEVPPVLNLSFLTNAGPSVMMDIAVSTLDSTLELNVNGKRDVAHRWLFPELDDLRLNPPVPSAPLNMTGKIWVDTGLNAEQRSAASSISNYRSPVPFLISGPPGTGKTRTVVETVHQILRTQPEAHILLCAPSNSATDTLALRLGLSLHPGDMLRLNDQNRTFAEVPDSIRQFCYVEDDRFALPPWKMLMRYRVVVTSCLDASILVNSACTNIVLCALEEHMVSSLHPHRKIKHPVVPHWTHLLIDEAAQGPEPEVLIPISVVLTSDELFACDQHCGEHANGTTSCDYHWLSTAPQLILCGDPNQLGPIITSQHARTHELDVSLIERLFDRPLYAEHVEARHHRRLPLTDLPLHQDKNYTTFKPFVNLVKNYRSHSAILMPPSAMFYNDSLEACASNGMISWAGLSNNKFPLMFLGCDAKDESVDERATWFNIGEISRIVEVITSLMSEASKSIPPLQVDEIGVMAPWREQVWKIREKLRKISLSRVDVGTVEDYQGREKRVVIISCVRSSARFLVEDGLKGIGLVFEKKRMNVAITRAKELLVIIGNGNLLKCDPYWKGFLQFALRNSLYVGPELTLEDDGAWISRLESKTAEAEEEVGLATVDHTGMRNTMMLAGGVVREILRDDV